MGDVLIRRGKPSSLATGTPQVAGANSFGASQVDDQFTRWLLEGRCFTSFVGSGSTEAAFAKSAYDEDQPQMVLRVPSGTTVFPLGASVSIEAQEDINLHVIIGFTQNDIGNGTSTDQTIIPMKTDGGGSACTVRNLYTGNSSTLTNVAELHRWNEPSDPAANAAAPGRNYHWGIRTHEVPLLVGPASLIFWIIVETGTDAEGYATVNWAEFPSAELV